MWSASDLWLKLLTNYGLASGAVLIQKAPVWEPSAHGVVVTISGFDYAVNQCNRLFRPDVWQFGSWLLFIWTVPLRTALRSSVSVAYIDGIMHSAISIFFSKNRSLSGDQDFLSKNPATKSIVARQPRHLRWVRSRKRSILFSSLQYSVTDGELSKRSLSESWEVKWAVISKFVLSKVKEFSLAFYK